MKIPNDPAQLSEFLAWIIGCCTASQWERKALYDRRRRYYLFGQNRDEMTRFNRLKSHMGLVSSFLYSPDGLQYNIAAPSNADDNAVKQCLALEDDWNEEFRDCGLGDLFSLALEWALVDDTRIIKLGWNDHQDQLFGSLIHPSQFGVFQEEEHDFDSQQAMTHSYPLDYDEAVERLTRAGKRDQISRLGTSTDSEEMGLPGTLTQLIISATGGSNLAGNVIGEVNPDFGQTPSFRARVDRPTVRFHETWVWDSDSDDWRIFHSVDPDIILSDSRATIDAMKKAAKEAGEKDAKYDSETNFFLKGENPFTPVRPYDLPDFFWGDAHIEQHIPLQEWSNERLEQIDEILQRQSDPAKVFSGFMGLQDEKADALGGPGSWVADMQPGAKVEELKPEMPGDLFAEFSEIGGLHLEVSGLTQTLAGKGEAGVRGKAHARELKITGGGKIRKVAVGLERPLVRVADIGLRLKMKNDDTPLKLDDGSEFVPSQTNPKFTMRIAGHSHSPLFLPESQEMAANLLKAKAIDPEWYVRLMNPPQKDNILHALRKRIAAEAQQRQQALAARAAGGAGKAHAKA